MVSDILVLNRRFPSVVRVERDCGLEEVAMLGV